MDAEMLYHKDAVFWLTNFKQIHSTPPHPLGAFFIQSLFWGWWYHYYPQRLLIAAQH